ncbi:hypothetical protein MNB_SV-5-644 [hydrothermal vent metagenome]|uniref:Uncharacterized protein n=1 Tax=hydrothermal vent metagenome TaxID=652676 RepID=A0A1W1EG05_9ZZZZ
MILYAKFKSRVKTPKAKKCSDLSDSSAIVGATSCGSRAKIYEHKRAVQNENIYNLLY